MKPFSFIVILLLLFSNSIYSQTWESVLKLTSQNGMANVVEMKTDAAGNIYMCGTFSGTLTFGTQSVVSVGDTDFFILKLSPLYECIWFKSGGGIAPDGATSIDIESSGYINITGYYTNAASYQNFPLTTNSGRGGMLLRINPAGGAVWCRNFDYQYTSEDKLNAFEKCYGAYSNNSGQIFFTYTDAYPHFTNVTLLKKYNIQGTSQSEGSLPKGVY